MPEPTISILAAVAAEETALRRALARVAGVRVHRIGVRGHLLDAAMIPPGGRVILAGLGGACAPELRAGDVLVDPWPQGLVCAGARRGRIACADRILLSPADKSDFRARVGADAVEMESDVVRAAAQRAGAEFFHVRVIFDTADETLPAEIGRWLAPDGTVRPGALLGGLVRRPWRIGMLAAMGRRSAWALRRLATVVEALVRLDERRR